MEHLAPGSLRILGIFWFVMRYAISSIDEEEDGL